MGRVVAIGVIAAIMAASCSGSDSGAPETVDTPPSSATAASIPSPPASAVVPTTTVPTPSTDADVQPETTDDSIVVVPDASDRPPVTRPSNIVADALAAMPALARGRVLEAGAVVRVRLGNFDAAAIDVGLVPATDEESSLAQLLEISSLVSVSKGGTGHAVIPPTLFPDGLSWQVPDEVEAEIGLELFEIRSFVETVSPGIELTVLEGNFSLADDLSVVAAGVVSAGEGEDSWIDFEQKTTLRPLGRPLRLALGDGHLAAGWDTTLVEDWLAPSVGTLLDIDAYASAADVLDAAGVSTAEFVEQDFAEEIRAFCGGSIRITEPFGLVASGSRVLDGRGVHTVVYVFADSESASRAVAQVTSAWRSGTSLIEFGSFFSDRFDLGAIEQSGRVVSVTAAVTDEGSGLQMSIMLQQRDAVFLYC